MTIENEIKAMTELTTRNNYRSTLLNQTDSDDPKKPDAVGERNGIKWAIQFQDKELNIMHVKGRDSERNIVGNAVLNKTKAGQWSGQMSTAKNPEPFQTRCFLKAGYGKETGEPYSFFNLFTEPYTKPEEEDF